MSLGVNMLDCQLSASRSSSGCLHAAQFARAASAPARLYRRWDTPRIQRISNLTERARTGFLCLVLQGPLRCGAQASSALDQIPHWRSCVSLLGGALRTEVQAYATGLYRRKSGDPLRYLAEEAAGYVAEGFKAVKLKVGFAVEEDVAATRAVRSAIGADVALMVDANHAYDAVDAIRLGRKIEGHDIGWFEEPVPPEDLVGYRAVKAALSIPIAGGE